MSTFIFAMFTKTFELSVLKEERPNFWHAYSVFKTLSSDTIANNLVILSMIFMLKLVFSDFVGLWTKLSPFMSYFERERFSEY